MKSPTIESDPFGADAHAPGAKLDAGKLMVGLVLGGFPRALKAVAEVATFGARKYTPGGWQYVPNGIERYSDAQYRHMLDRLCGEDVDAQTGLLHKAHEAWNALAVLELSLREIERETAA